MKIPRHLTLLAIVAASIWFYPPSPTSGAQERGQGPRKNGIDSEPRIALVIGNSAYAEGPLPNPVNDARDMAAALRGFGFDVQIGENLTRYQMEDIIREFGRKIRGGGVGMFYFAGHGVQVDGVNYLIPIDARINGEAEVKYQAMDVGFALAQMENANNRLNIVVLDACRNNPYASGFRSPTRGLAGMNAPVGTFIAYATAPGSAASDGKGRNGLYTKELLAAMKSPGLKLEDVFKRARSEVRRQSKGQQTPWESSSIEGDFYFSAERLATTGPADASPIEPVAPTVPYARVKEKKPLAPMGFTTAKVDVNGHVTRLPGQSVNGYIEQLPGGVKLEMVEVNGGTFMMGSLDNEEGRNKDEGPQHQVAVGDFYCGRYEVTQGQWKAVMGDLPVGMALSDLESGFKGDDLPVILVTWNDANEFIRKLNTLTQGDYRLPSEAEWEYAARGGIRARYAFGNVFSAEIVNNGGKIEKVGSRGVANAFGLFDTHGNVWEWCADDWHDSYKNAPANGRAWADISKRSLNSVLRGGSWNDSAVDCRSASRNGGPAVSGATNLGFRLVRSAR